MKVKIALASTGALLLLIQLIPVSRTNPPVEELVPAPDSVLAVLRQSCFDCHSHETRWPWYAHVAPASWLVAQDVNEGRGHLNFSTWNRYDAEKRADKLKAIWEEVDGGQMPLKIYLPLHPSARLSDQDRTIIHDWTVAARRGIQSPLDSTESEEQ